MQALGSLLQAASVTNGAEGFQMSYFQHMSPIVVGQGAAGRPGTEII
jgi:hypothetical protein